MKTDRKPRVARSPMRFRGRRVLHPSNTNTPPRTPPGSLRYPLSKGGKKTVGKIEALPESERAFPDVLKNRIRNLDLFLEGEPEEMSSGAISGSKGPTTAELIEMRNKRKRAAASGSVKVEDVTPLATEPPVTMSPSHSARAKATVRRHPQTKATSSGSVAVDLPASYDGRGALPPQISDQLLLPGFSTIMGAKSVVENMEELTACLFQGFQSSLFLKKVWTQAEKERHDLAAKNRQVAGDLKGIVAKCEAAEARLEEFSKTVANTEAELTACYSDKALLEVRLRDTEEKLKDAEERLRKKKEQLRDSCVYYSWKARVECLEDHAVGKSSEWDAVTERATFEEEFGGKPVPLDSDVEKEYADMGAEGEEHTSAQADVVVDSHGVPADEGMATSDVDVPVDEGGASAAP